MKPVFSPDRLATTDLTHTIIGASNLTNSVLASDLCRQALQEKRMEIQASPRSVEVKCSDVLHCHLGKVTVSPSFLPSFLLLRLASPPARPWRCCVSRGGAGAGATRAVRRGPAAGTETPACPRPPRSSRPPRSPRPAWRSGWTGGKREKERYRTHRAALRWGWRNVRLRT